jgi:hypothetical protein
MKGMFMTGSYLPFLSLKKPVSSKGFKLALIEYNDRGLKSTLSKSLFSRT